MLAQIQEIVTRWMAISVKWVYDQLNHDVAEYYSKIIHTVSFDPINQA